MPRWPIRSTPAASSGAERATGPGAGGLWRGDQAQPGPSGRQGQTQVAGAGAGAGRRPDGGRWQAKFQLRHRQTHGRKGDLRQSGTGQSRPRDQRGQSKVIGARATAPATGRALQREQDAFFARRNASFGRPDYDLRKAMRERLDHLLAIDGTETAPRFLSRRFRLESPPLPVTMAAQEKGGRIRSWSWPGMRGASTSCFVLGRACGRGEARAAMNIHDKSRYHEVHARSLADPEGFWAEAAREIDWIEPAKKISIPRWGFTAAGSRAPGQYLLQCARSPRRRRPRRPGRADPRFAAQQDDTKFTYAQMLQR